MVMRQAASIDDYKVDTNDKWCEVVLKMAVKDIKLDIAAIVQK